MEYKIAKFFERIRLPYVLRIFLWSIMLLLALIIAILPILPWALFFLVLGLLFFIQWNKIKYIIKLRKSFVYTIKNITKKNILRMKFRDMKKSFLKMLKKPKVSSKNKLKISNKINFNIKKTKTTIL